MSNAIFNDRKIDEMPIRVGFDDSTYPKQVKAFLEKHSNSVKKSFHHLDMVGNRKLLNMASLGICGSRKSSLKGLEIVRDCAEQAANNNVCVISGNAAGVDFEAHFNCLKFGGKTILVIPEGINHFRIRKGFSSVWDWDNVLVISQFEPNERWQGFRAMERNKLIVALSSAIIAIEAGDTGGTLDAGMATIKSKLPLYVAEYEDMSANGTGTQMLLEAGAQKLTKSRANNRANLTDLFEIIKKDDKALPRQRAFADVI